MQAVFTHTVKLLEKPRFLVDYAIGIFDNIPTKSSIKKALKKGSLKVNNEKVSSTTKVFGGETLTFEQIPDNKPSLKMDLNVLFEDDFLAIVYKPPGILVSSNSHINIANALANNLQPSTQKNALLKPLATHRLDYPTSGLLLIAKTTESRIQIGKLFENKQIKKTYHAICIGKIQEKGIINQPIDEKEAISEFEVVKTVASPRFTALNLVKLNPKTGRRHQLRKHLFHFGNPILGDKDYHLEGLLLKGKGLYLHATALAFTHPITGEAISVKSALPKKFLKIFPENE